MVAVVVPRGGQCPHREAAWDWVKERYAEQHPDWELIEAWAPAGVWSKGAAVNSVVARVDAEIVVVADADVWCEGVEAAVLAIVCGLAEWAMPHHTVHRLDEGGTAAVLEGEAWEGKPLAQRPYVGVWGGGIVVARRGVIRSTPLDELFVGWG